jgi:2,5-diamino-6-(ribosylamino)-4(3H)-pyrimidinone 5'-phosphate reductase
MPGSTESNPGRPVGMAGEDPNVVGCGGRIDGMDVVVNAATSVDGKLSSRAREQVEISGPADFDRVDRLRAASDAVMVGVGTVLADDPSLTLDDPGGGDDHRPARVVTDSRLRTPPDARVLEGDPATMLLTTTEPSQARIERLTEAGAIVLQVEATDDGHVDLTAGCDELERQGIDQLMVEGGGELVYSLFAAELVDRLSVFVGSLVIGGRDAPTLADGEGFLEAFPGLSLESVERLDDGVVLRYVVV